MAASKNLLGEYSLHKKSFPNLNSVFKKFHTEEFLALVGKKQREQVNQVLLELISQEPEPCFLLAAVIEFVERVDREKILEHYTLNSFELWLNQSSNLSFEDNYKVRAKIVGKKVDRSDYEAFFPIGMGKIYEGTHFVTAHKSPDLDTTVASFWGWMDAFAARVSNGLHVWNLPGGPPASQVEIDWAFRDLFGNGIFTHLSYSRSALTLSGKDLISLEGLLFKGLSDSIANIDHEREQYSVVVVDRDGYYLGDWRSLDAEGVSQVIILLNNCLLWFENQLHLQLISLFGKKNLHFDAIAPILKDLFYLKVEESQPVDQFTSKQKEQLENFIRSVLRLEKGIHITFDELGAVLAHLANTSFNGLGPVLDRLKTLFDSKGHLVEERSHIFEFLEREVKQLHESVFKIRQRLEFLDVALTTKQDVFNHHPTFVTLRSDIEEIRSKMGSYFSLTVTHSDRQGNAFPLGVIRAADLRKNFLGTVSLRDFCNRDEMSIASYLDVISVVDHHKSSLNTFSPPMAIIADVQSSNSLVADRAFLINDRHSLGGQTAAQIEEQIEKRKKDSSSESARIMQRLLKRQFAAKKSSACFVHPDREFIEYLHFMYAILDDTDLLSKVSSFDVECVASLLNRLKSLSCSEEVEIVSLQDLERDKNFPKLAAQRILQNEDMYSLYRKIYAYREKEVLHNIAKAAENKPSNLFADTKEQNGCCRVGQTKIFANNFASFHEHADSIRRVWLDNAMQIYQKKPEIDLHIHMISTIVSAEEVYQGKQGGYSHKDEMWIWVPQEEIAIEHLKRFLNGFQTVSVLKKTPMEVEFCGDNEQELSAIFKESFFEIPQKRLMREIPIAILRFNAGLLNSRKAMVSPYLPSLNL